MLRARTLFLSDYVLCFLYSFSFSPSPFDLCCWKPLSNRTVVTFLPFVRRVPFRTQTELLPVCILENSKEIVRVWFARAWRWIGPTLPRSSQRGSYLVHGKFTTCRYSCGLQILTTLHFRVTPKRRIVASICRANRAFSTLQQTLPLCIGSRRAYATIGGSGRLENIMGCFSLLFAVWTSINIAV